MSRHLYDLERLMDTEFGKQALQDMDLYERIVKHRSIYYAVGYVDYSKLMPSEIDFVPRQELMKDWFRINTDNVVSSLGGTIIVEKNSYRITYVEG
jgi:hypothetical protein